MRTPIALMSALLLAASPFAVLASGEEPSNGAYSHPAECSTPQKRCEVWTSCDDATGECREERKCWEEPGRCEYRCEPDRRTASVKITVHDAQTWDVLTHVRVALFDANGNTVAWGDTSGGAAAFEQIPPGEYRAHLEAAGYFPNDHGFYLAPGEVRYEDARLAAEHVVVDDTTPQETPEGGSGSSDAAHEEPVALTQAPERREEPTYSCPPPPCHDYNRDDCYQCLLPEGCDPCPRYDDRQYSSEPARPCPPPCDERHDYGEPGPYPHPEHCRYSHVHTWVEQDWIKPGEPVGIHVEWKSEERGQLAVWIVKHHDGPVYAHERPQPADTEPHRDCVDETGNFVRCEPDRPEPPVREEIVYKFELGDEASRSEGFLRLIWKQVDSNGNQVEPGGYEIRAEFAGAIGGTGIWIGEREEPPQPCPGFGHAEARAHARAESVRGDGRAYGEASAEAIAVYPYEHRTCGFEYADGQARGQHVTFALDESTGDVFRYTVSGTTVFDQITVSGGNPISEVRNMDWLFAKGKTVAFGFMDAPGGAILSAPCAPAGETIVYKLALGSGIEAEGDGQAAFLSGAFHGVISLSNEGELWVEGGVVYARMIAEGIRCEPDSGEEPRSFLAFHGKGGFVEPLPVVDREFEAKKAQALATGRLGAEALLEFEGDLPKLDSVDYTGVKVELKAARTGHAEFTVDSDEHEGKIVTFTLPRRILNVMSVDEIAVLFDGTGARQARDWQDLESGCGGEACFLIAIGGDVVQVLFSVPHFSVHSITIQSTGAVANPMWLGAVAGLAMITGASVLALRRRND